MAGEQRQEWVWRDIFRSIGLAFSFSRLFAGFLGIALMAVVDGLLSWVVTFDVWSPPGSWMAWLGGPVMGYARLVVLGYIFLYTATAIAYSVKGELLDGEGAGAGESIGFVFKKFGSIFWTPFLFWIYIGVMAGFAFIGFAIGLIPYVGPILVTLGWFLVVIFAVLAAMGFLAFAFSFFLAPPIIATRQEGALDAVLDTIDLMRGKGAFWVAILVFGASVLIGPVFMGKTLDVTYKAAQWTMDTTKEARFSKWVKCMPKEIQPRGRFFVKARQFWPGGYGGARASQWGKGRGITIRAEVTGVDKAAGWILGIWVLILGGFSISFAVGAFVSAGTLTYLIVREEEEFLEPAPVEAPAPVPAPERSEPSTAEEKEKPKKQAKKESKKGMKKQSKRESKKSKRSG